MITAHRIEVALYAIAGLLLAATVAARALNSQEGRTRHAAAAALDKLLAAERTYLAARKQFALFGPAVSDLAAALPGVILPETADFTFDALPDQNGVLHVRAVSRPDSVASGSVFPMLVTEEIAGGPKAEPVPGDR